MGFDTKPAPQKWTFRATIEYLSSDRITTWSIRRFCSSSPSFTLLFQICDPTSIDWVAIENPPVSVQFSHYFTTIQRISVRMQIWMQGVKERLKLNNLRSYHIMIRLKLKYLIEDKVVGTVKWNRGSVRTSPWTVWLPLFSGYQPGLDHPGRFRTRTAAG